MSGLSPKELSIVRSTWTAIQSTDASSKFYNVVFSQSAEAADVFKRMQIKSIFTEFDENGDGSIQLSELQKGIHASSNDDINKDDLLPLVRGVSDNPNDELNIEQFTDLIDRNPGVIKAYDVAKQGKKVFDMFGTLVALAGDVNTLVPVLKALGGRHVDYGVNASYFPAIGNALITVLTESLGSKMDGEATGAWVKLYDIASSSMIAGLGGQELTKRQKHIIKDSWSHVVGDASASGNFYDRLFVVAPSSAEIFKTAQARRVFEEVARGNKTVTASQLAGAYNVEVNADEVKRLLAGKTDSESISFNDFKALVDSNPEILNDYNGAAQGRRIFDMITVVVGLIDDLKALRPVLATVGARHSGYGVSPERFAPLGETLLWTVARSLGDTWNAELEDAWTSVYRLASSEMINALNKSKL